MGRSRYLKVGDVTGSKMQNAKEATADNQIFDIGFGPSDPAGNRMIVSGAEGPIINPDDTDPNGVVPSKDIVKTDATRDFIASPKVLGVPVVLESRQQLLQIGTRGFAVQDDHPLRLAFPMMGSSFSRSGRWRAGFQPGVLPEDVDPLWRTPVSGTYTTMNGTLVVGDIMQGASTSWSGKLIALDTGAKTWTVSLYSGTSATETLQKVGATSNNLTGVVIQFGNGATTGYADTSGLKVKRRGPTGSIYNGFNAQSASTFLNPTLGTLQPPCWTKFPGYMNSSLWAMPNILDDGAPMDVQIAGDLVNTCDPDVDLPFLSMVLAVGQNMFAMTNLHPSGAAALAQQVEFLTPTLPATTKIPFTVHIRAWSPRHEDRAPAQIYVCEFTFPSSYWGGNGTYTSEVIRGGDNPTSVISFPGFDFRAGQRIGIHFTTSPFLPTSGLCQVEFRSISARCGR